MTDSSEQEAKSCLDRLKRELETESLMAGFPVCLAAGYALMSEGEGDTVEMAFNRTDQRMYEDKKRQKAGDRGPV